MSPQDYREKEENEKPPGAPDRTPVKDPGQAGPPMGDPKPAKKKKKLG